MKPPFKPLICVALLCGSTFAPAYAAPGSEATLTLPAAPGQIRLVPAPADDKPTLVIDRRPVDLQTGRNTVRFAGTSDALEPDTLQLVTAEGAPVTPLEQRWIPGHLFQLNNYIGQTLTLQREKDTITGKLLMLQPTLFETENGVLVNPSGTWVLPKGVVPWSPLAMEWVLDAPAAGHYLLEARYATTKVHWRATYRATLNEAGDTLDFQGWIAFQNGTDANWPGIAWSIPVGSKFLENTRPLDLPPHSSQEIAFITQSSAPVTTSNVFRASSIQPDFLKPAEGAPVRAVRVQVSNESGSRGSLPGGNLVVWQKSATGNPVLVSRQTLPDTEPGQPVVLALNGKTGLYASRTIATRRLNPQTREHQVKIVLSNHSDRMERVTVQEDFPANSTLTETGPEPTGKFDSGAHWDVEVAAGGTTEIEYVLETKN